MHKVPQRKKWYQRFDTWSSRLMVGLFAIGLLFVLVDVALVAAIVLQNRGLELGWLFAPQATPVIEPVMWISPQAGEPGTVISIMGKGWQAHDPLVVQIDDPWGAACQLQVVATVEAAEDGSLSALVTYPDSGCWAGLSRAQLGVRSLGTARQAFAGFQIVSAVHTPTPTVVAEPTMTPIETQQPTPTLEPTSTPIPAPATATPTPTTAPTATPTPTFVPPPPTPTPAIVDWRGEYFGNSSLVGDARVVRNDRGPNGTLGIGFDWGYGGPADSLPADGFSARWTRALNFEQGRYRFTAAMDDGLRLFVDGDLVINEWRDGSQRQATAERWMAAGLHTLRVEYYERSGVASVRLGWEKVASYPDWKGEYWPNVSLSGNPVLVRNDTSIAFDWRQGTPGNAVPVDAFSARWTRQVAFETGTYRFHALVDDGVRLWVNDRPIIDAWSDHDAVELTADYALAKGTYALRVEYYERIGNARIQVWWEKVEPSYPDWKGEYWPNRDLSGPVTLVRNDKGPHGTLGIDFNWGPNAPASALPADNFSARWTRKAEFEGTTYRFHALADDGVRLWVDGVLLIDQWRDQEPREWTADRAMVAGKRTIVVEYYEHTGGARIQIWWEKIALSFPDWKGEYWPNRDLGGAAALIRNDKGPKGTLGLEFDWGSGAPAPGLPVDDFSARWTRQVTLDPGIYRLQARADDGIRAYVDGRLVLDEWHSYRDVKYTVDMPLGGVHQLEVRHYERGGGANIRVSWQRIGDLPTPVPMPSVGYSSATYTVSEGSGSATITVVLSGAYNRPVTVDYATAGGTASGGSDYIPVNGRLTFEPGVTSRTFAVTIVEDAQDEADETIVLVLSNPGNAALGATYQATCIIVDNDEPTPPPQVQFSAGTYTVAENAQSATITVVLGRAHDRPVTVDYATAGGTASSEGDYIPLSGRLTFDPGVTSRTFAVTVVDDVQDEADETVVLSLSNPGNATLGATYLSTLVIVDNDEPLPMPDVQFGAGTYSVDEGAEIATIVVSLSSTYDRPVTVGYEAAGGTADVGSDYETVLGTLTFEPGSTEQSFIVHVLNDEQDEEDETIVLRLTDAQNAALGERSQATLVIVDDDTIAPAVE